MFFCYWNADNRARHEPSPSFPTRLASDLNNTFQDNYLEVPFDLSKVLFIATGNLMDPIPAARRDRMEIVQLPGYTQQEKIERSEEHKSELQSLMRISYAVFCL